MSTNCSFDDAVIEDTLATAARGDVSHMEDLLKRYGPDIGNVRTPDGGEEAAEAKPFSTPLLEAIKYNHVRMVDLLLEAGANPNRGSISEGSFEESYSCQVIPPIHAACQNGSIDVIRSFLKHGARIDEPDCFGQYPEHYLAKAMVEQNKCELWDEFEKMGFDFTKEDLIDHNPALGALAKNL